jgi:hypothetical protein
VTQRAELSAAQNNFESVLAALTPALAVEELHRYALYTRHQREKVVSQALSAKGFDALE